MISKKSSSRLHFESRAKMLKCKRSQQEIIVTVLLVLIALAAVAAVATFFINNIKKSTAGADDKLNCAKVELDISAYSNTSSATNSAISVSVFRTGTGDVALKNVTVAVNGNIKIGNNGDLTSGSSAVLTITNNTLGVTSIGFKKGDLIETAAVLSDGYACAVAASETVA